MSVTSSSKELLMKQVIQVSHLLHWLDVNVEALQTLIGHWQSEKEC